MTITVATADPSSRAALPCFSVVVPTYNRPGRLSRCVKALDSLDYPRDAFEVIIVDDGGSIPIDPGEHGLQLRVIRQHNAGPAAARNRGAAEAAHTYLAFTDDDCAPDPLWLSVLAKALQATPEALVGGRIVNDLPRDRFAIASQTITDFAYDWAIRVGRGTGPGGAWLFATANVACPRSTFHELGGFDESFPLAAGEDYDFCHHWQHAGHPAVYEPDAVVRHSHSLSLRSYCRQHFAYGRGLLQFRRRATRRLGTRAEHNLGGFQSGLARYCLRRLRGPDTWINAALVGMSQVATLTGAAVEMMSRRDAGEPSRPLSKSQCAS